MGSGDVRNGGDLLGRPRKAPYVPGGQRPMRTESALAWHSHFVRSWNPDTGSWTFGNLLERVVAPSLVRSSTSLARSEARHITIQMHTASSEAPVRTCYDDLGTTETTRISFGQRFGTARFFCKREGAMPGCRGCDQAIAFCQDRSTAAWMRPWPRGSLLASFGAVYPLKPPEAAVDVVHSPLRMGYSGRFSNGDGFIVASTGPLDCQRAVCRIGSTVRRGRYRCSASARDSSRTLHTPSLSPSSHLFTFRGSLPRFAIARRGRSFGSFSPVIVGQRGCDPRSPGRFRLGTTARFARRTDRPP